MVHDGPRAGINQNDGFHGGSEFAFNLVFNTVLDTGDHGNFNSWDRKPWIWLADDDVATLGRVGGTVSRHSVAGDGHGDADADINRGGSGKARDSESDERGGDAPNSLRMVPQPHSIHHNFMVRTAFVGTSNNLYCLDHDDGSSMYNDTYVLVYLVCVRVCVCVCVCV